MGLLKPETAVRLKLLANGALATAFGSRIYPLAAPENAEYPLALMGRAKTEIEYHAGGPSDFEKGTIRISIWHRDYTALDPLAKAMKNTLCDENGFSLSQGLDSIAFDHFRLENQWEDTEEAPDGTGQVIYAVYQDYNTAWEIPAGE